MARGVNKVILIGHLGQDPETRYVPSGAAVTTFSIAVTESWKDKQTGEQKERTEWVNIEVWGKIAEACAKYLHKGSQCYVEGQLKTDSWEDKDTGEKKYRTKVHSHTVQFLSGSSNQDSAPKPKPKPQPEGFDDDIPF